MSFHAYPGSATCCKSQNIFLKVQGILHRTDSVALPVSLLIFGSSLLVYQHMTDSMTGRHSIRNFMAKILASMIPLVILERKILQCTDPVGLFAKFSAKVLLMHACFLGLRLACLVFPDVQVGYTYCNTLAFVGACILLPWVFGVRLTAASLFDHRDVWCLALITLMVSLLEVALLGQFSFSKQHTRGMFVEDVVSTGSDYIEILGFVPAVWMACRPDSGAPASEVADSKKRAACLFAFLTAFYCVEDLAQAASLGRDFPLVSCSHIAHFLLFADFAAFLLAHLYDPDKLAKFRGALYSWLTDACAV